MSAPWKFKKFLPDMSDVDANDACRKAFTASLAAKPLGNMNEAERDVFLFDSGFARGCAWMRHKEGEEPVRRLGNAVREVDELLARATDLLNQERARDVPAAKRAGAYALVVQVLQPLARKLKDGR